MLWFNPVLPDELGSLDLWLRYRDQLVDVHVDHDELVLAAAPGPAAPVSVAVAHVDGRHELHAADTVRFELRTAARPHRPPVRSAP